MRKPNIVYVLADDLGYGDLSCYGVSMVETERVDHLASEGMRFVDAHSPSAVCTPTRYSVLTGRYSWRSRLKSGVLWGHSEPLIEQDQLTVPHFLKQQGYETACIGKWHLGLGWAKDGEAVDYSQPIKNGPTQLGFDYFYGISASLDMPPYCFIHNDQTVGIPSVEKTPKDFSQRGRSGLMTSDWKDEEVNKILTEKAVAYIKEQTQSTHDEPFFLYFALTGPHTPWKTQKQFEGKSGIGPRGDMILELDWTIGQLVDVLKECDIWDDTLFVLTSDNGPHPSPDEIEIHGHKPAGDFRGQKADIWEGGHRVPFIASWPRVIEAGTVTEQLICLTDLLATCFELTNDQQLNEADAEDSISMFPVLQGEESNRNIAVHHSLTGMFSIRKGDWKLIIGQGSGGFRPDQLNRKKIGIPTQGEYKQDESPGQLYHIGEDETESHNLFLQRPDIVQSMTKDLIELINNGARQLNR